MSNSVFMALYIYLFLNLRALLLHPHPLFTIWEHAGSKLISGET